MRAQFVLQEIWIGLRRNLTMTIALIVVVAISLSLLGTGLLFVKQVDRHQNLLAGQGRAVDLPVHQDQPAARSASGTGPPPTAEQAQMQQRLKSMPQVEHVYYVNQQQAYQQFRQYFSNEPALVQDTQEGDIPDSFQVKLKNPEADYNIVASAVNGTTGVETVVDDDDDPGQVLPAARRGQERGDHHRADPDRGRRPAGGQHDQAVRLQPAPGNRDHAPGRGVELLHPAAVPARRARSPDCSAGPSRRGSLLRSSPSC